MEAETTVHNKMTLRQKAKSALRTSEENIGGTEPSKKLFKSQIWQQQHQFENQCKQAEESSQQKLITSFGFIANPDETPSCEACIQLTQPHADLTSFQRPSNFASHDLTTHAKPSANLKTFLNQPIFLTSCVMHQRCRQCSCLWRSWISFCTLHQSMSVTACFESAKTPFLEPCS